MQEANQMQWILAIKKQSSYFESVCCIWPLQLATDSMMSLVALIAASLLFVSSPADTSAQGDNSCRACNCQFNNIEVLDRMIESKINKSLANDPGEISQTTHH